MGKRSFLPVGVWRVSAWSCVPLGAAQPLSGSLAPMGSTKPVGASSAAWHWAAVAVHIPHGAIGETQGHQYTMWCSCACHKPTEPDVPTGFSYMRSGRQLRCRDGQIWQRWPRQAVWAQHRLGQPTRGHKGLMGLCMVGAHSGGW